MTRAKTDCAPNKRGVVGLSRDADPFSLSVANEITLFPRSIERRRELLKSSKMAENFLCFVRFQTAAKTILD